VRKGNFKETAAKAASITSHTLNNGINAGKAAKKGKFFDFFTALARLRCFVFTLRAYVTRR
jgi:hypothetical protein